MAFNEIEELDLPYDPLETSPNLGQLTQGYVASARDPFLAQVQPYSKYIENMGLERANLERDVIRDNLTLDRLTSLQAMDSTSSKRGKMGFAASGMYDMLDRSIYDSMESLTEKAYGESRSRLIGAKGLAVGEREKYSDSLWNLYSDFLLAGPDELDSPSPTGGDYMAPGTAGGDLGGTIVDVGSDAGLDWEDVWESITPWNDDCPPWDWNCW